MSYIAPVCKEMPKTFGWGFPLNSFSALSLDLKFTQRLYHSTKPRCRRGGDKLLRMQYAFICPTCMFCAVACSRSSIGGEAKSSILDPVLAQRGLNKLPHQWSLVQQVTHNSEKSKFALVTHHLHHALAQREPQVPGIKAAEAEVDGAAACPSRTLPQVPCSSPASLQHRAGAREGDSAGVPTGCGWQVFWETHAV